MTHKAILIDPHSRTVTLLDQEPGLQSLYAVLSHETKRVSCIDAFYPAPDHAMYIDDEGMMFPDNPTFSFLGHPGLLFAGKALIVGTFEHDDADVKLDIDDLRERIVFLELKSTGEFGPGGPTEETPDGWAIIRAGAPILKES